MSATETSTPNSTADQLAQVDSLRPVVEAQVEQAEERCQLDASVYDALRSGGFLRMLTPSAYGGSEMSLPHVYRVVEEVSAIDGATGWNLNQSLAMVTVASWFPEASSTIFSDPDVVVAGALWPPAQGVDADGGLSVSGRLPFVSGSGHARWVFGGAVRTENGEPVVDSETGAPDFRGLMLSIDDLDIIETWDPVGMRGTGSNDVEAAEAFVPAARTAVIQGVSSAARSEAWANPIYGMTPWIGIQLHGAVPVGIARGALSEALELVQEKVPNYYDQVLKEKGTALAALGRARAHLDGASAYLASTAAAATAEVEVTGSLSPESKVDLQLSASHAADAAMSAIDLVCDVAGTTAIRRGTSLERKVRDVRTITRHTAIQRGRYESCGQIMVGAQSDWFPFNV